MAAFIRGDVVVLPFPMSSEEKFKRRPAVVVASWPYKDSSDYLVCIITTQPNGNDPYIQELENSDLRDPANGKFRKKSYIRPAYMFAADEGLILYRLGSLKPEKLAAVLKSVRSLFFEPL